MSKQSHDKNCVVFLAERLDRWNLRSDKIPDSKAKSFLTSNCSRRKTQTPCQTNQEEAGSWLNLDEKETVFQVKVGPHG